MRQPAVTLALCLTAGTVAAETDFTALTPEERAVFHAEIRSVLLAHPELVRDRRQGAQDTYAEDIANDLALIRDNADQLFAPVATAEHFGQNQARNVIAVFVGPDCPDCARAVDDLRALAESQSLWVQVFDRKVQPGLADRLGVDTLPFYVFPRMMLRGAIPAPVIARYLDRGTGQ
ncbi:hypothetical protein [Marimonas arenosa]|uniref:Thioredoxin family protein n=1 Tax=Marimonas arenosa TaxID=1795305 RepID=A0AAE3WAF0_9RHOB|nr:hypothetical protein [Marimonas arenosa]MDQ2089124.1 thioredoxin family protein [Marimonas arenosa]